MIPSISWVGYILIHFLLTLSLKKPSKLAVKIFRSNDIAHDLKKTEFKEFVSLATEELYFIFHNILCKQIYVGAMGSPLAPSLANAFLSHYEQNWLISCPQEYRSLYY